MLTKKQYSISYKNSFNCGVIFTPAKNNTEQQYSCLVFNLCTKVECQKGFKQRNVLLCCTEQYLMKNYRYNTLFILTVGVYIVKALTAGWLGAQLPVEGNDTIIT